MPHGLVHESGEKLRAHFLHTGTPSATGLLEVELVWAGPRNHVLCAGQDPHGKVHFWGRSWAWPDWPALSILNVFF